MKDEERGNLRAVIAGLLEFFILDSSLFIPQKSRFVQRGEKVLSHSGQRLARDGWSGHQNHVHGLRQVALMQPEGLAQQTSNATACHRTSDLAADNDADPRP